MSLVVPNGMVVSNNFSFATVLNTGQTITKPADIVTSFSSIHMTYDFDSVPDGISFKIYATSESVAVPTYHVIDTYSPTTRYSTRVINFTARMIYLAVENGPIQPHVMTIFANYSPISDGGSIGTIDSPITSSTSLGLTRDIIAGRGKLTTSSVSNMTMAASNSIRIVDGTLAHGYNDNVDEIVRLTTETNDLGKFTNNGGTVTIVPGTSVTVTSGTTGLNRAVQFVAPVVDNNSVVVFRGDAKITASSELSGFCNVIHGHVGIGTNGPDLGLWYNTDGIMPVVVLNIAVAASTNSTVTITLNGIPYICTLTGTNPSYPASSAAEIVSAFDTLDAPWSAKQRGRLVYFYGLSPGVVGTVSLTTTDPTFNGTMTSPISGANPTWVFIPRTSFNINVMPEWVSGDTVEYEITAVGRNIKLAVVDKNTKELKDVHVETAASPVFYYPDYHISMSTSGANAVLNVYSASIGILRGTAPKRPIRNTVATISTGYAYSGSTSYPVAIIVKRPLDNRPIVLKKIIIDCTYETRVTVNVATNATMNGAISPITSANTTRYVVYTIPYSASNVPSTFGYSGNDVIYSDNFLTKTTIDLNWPIDIFRALTLAVRTDGYTPTPFTYWLIFDEY